MSLSGRMWVWMDPLLLLLIVDIVSSDHRRFFVCMRGCEYIYIYIYIYTHI